MVASLASRSSGLAALALAACLAGAGGCDKVPLTAPTQSTVTLFTSTTRVPLNGSAEITATVIESAGTPVQNGTTVTFTTNLGTIEPREARTQGGKALVRFVAGGTSGTATVSAFSGSATAEADLELQVGAAAADRVLLNVSPGTVPSGGGTVTITATVLDENGNRVSGVPVTFSSTAGTLLNGTVLTDGAGEARTTLTTNRAATVTASAGAETQTVEITVNASLTVSVTAPTTSPTAGQPTTFTVNVTSPTNGLPVQTVTIDFGDGTRQSLGTLTGSTSIQHTYSAAGAYLVTVTATDVGGESVSQSTSVTVLPRQPFLLTLTVTGTPSTITPGVNIFQLQTGVTITASPSGLPSNVQISSYQFDFGDGSSPLVQQSPTTTKFYGETGNKTIRVTATATDGQRATAQTQVSIVSR